MLSPPLPFSTTSSSSSPSSSSSSSSSVSFRLRCFCFHRRGRRLHYSSPSEHAIEDSTPFRSRSIWNKKRQLISRNPVRKTCFSRGVFNSLESQETRSSGSLAGKSKLLIDCGPEQECVLGGIVALGKFDALHIGHRQLAIQAAKVGVPFLLCFVGIAEVLGWEYRAPVVAKCDRKRVLSLWAPYCAAVVPQEYHVDFASVRYLSPRQFVEKLSGELGVAGVVAGENYRFGYRAAGDASELVKLCAEYGLKSYIVRSVMDENLISHNGTTACAADKGEKVSSTRIRQALAEGDMGCVERLLGRKHRLVLDVTREGCTFSGNALSIPKSCMLNQPPKEGLYECCSLLIDDKLIGSCRVTHASENINVEIVSEVGTEFADSSSLLGSSDHQYIGIEFG